LIDDLNSLEQIISDRNAAEELENLESLAPPKSD
jgi:hypothetical protein